MIGKDRKAPIGALTAILMDTVRLNYLPDRVVESDMHQSGRPVSSGIDELARRICPV